ncbi:MAG TPA: cation:proton antiporter [Rubrobacter sp.]|nr:cation:proton antiporter [Rubrobacter sp.]
MVDLTVLAAVVFAFGLVSRRLEGTIFTAPIVFVAAGVVLGPAGLGLVEFDLDDHTVLMLGEIALALVLFTDAARTNLPSLRQNEGLPLRLLGIGMPLTIILGTGIAALMLTDLTVWEAAIVGTVLAPTDAALGQAVVSNPRVPLRVRQALNVEAGLNDGLSVPFLALFLTLAVAGEELQPATYWLRFALEQVGLGVLVGVGVGLAGSWLVRQASRRGWMTNSFERLALLAMAIITWGLADLMGGNGFIAAFIGGLVVGPVGERLIRFTEAEGQLLNLSVFFIFGVLAIGLIETPSWRVVLYAALSLTLVRMLPVAASLLGTSLHSVSVLFIGWFGPRGLASIVLGLIVVAEAPLLAGRGLIEQVVALTVLLSVLLHGVTAAPFSAAYTRRVEKMSPGAPERSGAVKLATGVGSVPPRDSQGPVRPDGMSR